VFARVACLNRRTRDVLHVAAHKVHVDAVLVDAAGVGAAGVRRSALHALGYRTVSHAPRPRDIAHGVATVLDLHTRPVGVGGPRSGRISVGVVWITSSDSDRFTLSGTCTQ